MATRPQPQGAPIERSAETRALFCVLLTELAGVCLDMLAAVTEALLRSEGASLPAKAALRLLQAALAPAARELEAMAAKYRAPLEPHAPAMQADGGAAVEEPSGRLPALRLLPPAPLPAVFSAAPAAPILRPLGHARPSAGRGPPPDLAEEAVRRRQPMHAHFVAIS